VWPTDGHEEAIMKAQVGDRLVIKGHRINEADHEAEILEVRGAGGEPPYLIRWNDSDRDTLVFPGSDARIVHPLHRPQAHEVLGKPARDATGTPTLTSDEATTLVRHHIDLEKLRTTDYDAEIWGLWQDEVGHGGPEDHNADVLDRVLERLRQGE